jgi:hypothetical protein
MDRKGAATVARAVNLRDYRRNVNSSTPEGLTSPADRLRWAVALRHANHSVLVAHLRARDRPSKCKIMAVAAAVIMRAHDGSGRCMASVSTLADDIGSSPSTVRVVLAVLTRAGRLNAERRSVGRTSEPDTTVYRMVIPPPESGEGTPGSGVPSTGVLTAGTPESGPNREESIEESKARAPVFSWLSTVPMAKWNDLFTRHRAPGEPFQSDDWKRRACEAES